MIWSMFMKWIVRPPTPVMAVFATELLRSSLMPTDHIVALLITERDKLNRAIEALQGPEKRRGRPPKNDAGSAPVAAVTPTKRKGRPPMSAPEKKAASLRMKAYWAAKRKAKK
jgi:hypothetical protein